MLPPRIVDNNAFLMATGDGSRIEIHAAAAAKESWTQLSQTVRPGDDVLRFSEATGWEVGDRIAIASSDRSADHAEEFTITAVSNGGRSVTIDGAARFKHDGVIETYSNGLSGGARQEWDLDLRAEVALLSRNVKIQGDADSEIDHFGGHTMVMMGADMHISGAEFEHMGQEGILGRYPVHWHMLGDASGQYLQNSSVHGSFNKGVTIHGSQNAWLEDNVVFDTIGHGFFFEDGSETGNVLIGNLAFGQVRNATEALSTIDSDFFVPTSYWIMNPNNHFVDNHAAGAVSTGFWFLGNQSVTGVSVNDDRFQDIIPRDDVIGVFSGNTSHANARGIRIGGDFDELSVDGAGPRGNDTVARHLTEMQPPAGGGANEVFDFQFDDFAAYDNNTGIWQRGFGGDYNNLMLADNMRGVFARGLQSFNDSLIVGRSDQLNTNGGYDSDRYHGIQLYDESLEINNSHFAGFTGQRDGGVSQHVAVESSTSHNMEGVTIENGSRFMTNFNALDDETNQQGTTISGIIDLDGRVTGQAGAIITPRLEGTPSGLNIIEAGFNAAPGATYSARIGGWINPAGVEIGILEFGNASQNPHEVWRSDQGHLGNLGSDMHGDELIIIGGDVVDYTLDYTNHSGPNVLEFGWHDVSVGTVVDFTFLGLSASATFQDVNVVGSLAALNQADVTSVYFDGQAHHVRMVATHFYYAPKEGEDRLDDANYSDYFEITLNGDRPARPDNNPNAWYPGRPGNYHFQGAATDEDIVRTLPERAPSTSNTVTIQEQDNRWSEASSWTNGIPDATSIVVIGAGERIIIDQDVTVGGIIVNGGELIVEDTADIAMSTDWLLVGNGGLFQAGTEQDPFVHNFTITLEGDNPEFDLEVADIIAGYDPRATFATPQQPSNEEALWQMMLAGSIGTAGGGTGGTSGSEAVIALAGENVITTLGGADLIVGGIGDDIIRGNNGNDVIVGDNQGGVFGGDDVIYGGNGNDVLQGGKGADLFVFYANQGNDQIGAFDIEDIRYDPVTGFGVTITGRDFAVGEDRIALSGFSDLSEGNVLSSGALSSFQGGTIFEAQNTRVSLYGVELETLSESDFTFL
jgi:hypothetical protein